MPPPTVSVIVPARNEEASIGRCLQSLRAQTGVSYEIIVVDDSSTDRTREIVASVASVGSVRLLQAGPLPPGWQGKAHACQVGANFAGGKWLLFTDADTFHLPGSLARAVGEAEQRGAALLSYSPEQEVAGWLQRALMPVIFAELARQYPPRQVSDPHSRVVAANGQYLLITRETYNEVGGHSAVAGNLLEDVGLAAAVKQSGRKLFFRYAKDAVRTRMYRSPGQMCEGWTKNLALLFPKPSTLAMRRAVEFAVIAGCFAGGLAAVVNQSRYAAPACALLLAAALTNFCRRVKAAHFGWLSTLLAPLGLPLFAYLLRRSRICHKRGKVSWKGRTY